MQSSTMNSSQLAESHLRWVIPTREPELIAQLNITAGVNCDDALLDYGRLHRQSDGFWLFQPSSRDQAIMVWQALVWTGRMPRIRGAGHSMHGGSIPLPGEVLLSTLRLNGLHWDLDHPKGARVTAGAGAQVWMVDALARDLGYRLPVVHDGGPAASVGGFISAGGFGVDSDRYGGFWNHVHQLDYLSPGGEQKTLTTHDPRFWSCFGGVGQGHLLLSAELRLIPDKSKPKPSQSSVDLTPPREASLVQRQHPAMLWFTLVAPAEQEWRVRPIIANLHHEFLRYWKAQPPYRYRIARLNDATPENFHPCADRDLIACGVWGIPLQSAEHVIKPMLEFLEAAIAPYPEIRRYWQSELSIVQL